ncbi:MULTISPECIES: TadE/TadG family type IV pilus assembly protein [Actinomyces]|uniref:Pilus assembly protein n=2 Tax=Actinomyces TaxID=1654 RepID=A0A853EH71_9ACTO|nr:MULTISPECIES: TadE/TadG family type IV pilus assembly protein [Actinomyces]MBF0695812.1 pilus assembly protein [Actinomyces bowdenii]MCR2053715.1 pilus assembly protein [Actinomyces bowdenii]MDO5064556.1 TadE/TadG family type IV pilus assembly protein [Actinomyces bowdenii]NYS67985.1 pilus assembly protein [Actinomyces bowdenii]
MIPTRMRRLRDRRDETGASSVELLVFFPLLLLIVLFTVQVALSWYGNEVAITTAREVAREIRSGSSPEKAEADGIAYAHRVGGKALAEVEVYTVIKGNEVVVVVSGEAMDVVAGLAPRVEASVTSQLETFREDT